MESREGAVYKIENSYNVIFNYGRLQLSVCDDTTYVEYPLKLKYYATIMYHNQKEPLAKDTSVTWMAVYADMYGRKDSTEITTVFKGL